MAPKPAVAVATSVAISVGLPLYVNVIGVGDWLNSPLLENSITHTIIDSSDIFLEEPFRYLRGGGGAKFLPFFSF